MDDKKTKKKSKNNYLDNKELMKEIIESKRENKMSKRLSIMLMLLVNKYSKHPWFSGYTYIDDMRSFALLNLTENWQSFDPLKYKNPHAYYTKCVYNSFQQFKFKEKHHRKIRDELLVYNGFRPSNTYMQENSEQNIDNEIFEKENYHEYKDDLE